MSSVDKRFPFKTAIKLLKTFGVWVDQNSSRGYLAYGIVLHLVFVELCIFLQIAEIPNLETIQDVASLMSLLPTYIGVFFKTLNIVVRRSKVNKLLKLTNELFDESPNTSKVLKRLKIVDRFYKANITAAMVTCFGATVLTIYKLPYKMWFPYDIENNRLGYWSAAIYQSVGPTSLAVATISLDMIPIFFMCYAAGFLEVLCDRLESIKKKASKATIKDEDKSEDHVDNYEELMNCIKFQWKIDEYFEAIDEMFSSVFFVQGLISIPILCTSIVSLTFVSRVDS